MLDTKTCECITKLVEKLATSGKHQIDKIVFREFVSHAGKSEEYIKFTLERIFQHLEQKHSEIRLGAFLIIDELFKRSHYFREILLDDFHTFLELTVESNPSKLLPPPLPTAKILKQSVLQAIQKWYSTFGVDHKRLALSYNFLKNNLKVDFQDALKRNASELAQEHHERQRHAKVVEKKVRGVEAELNDNQDEIMKVVTEMDNCFCLLIPKPDDFGENQLDDEEDSSSEQLNLREHGFTTTGVSINVQMSSLGKVVVTEDNLPIIENLKDLNALLKNRFIPLIKKWVAITSKATNQTLFKKLMGLKAMLEKQVNRFNHINVSQEDSSKRVDSSSSSNEDDSDFEDVPEKEGFEYEAVSPPVVMSPPDAQKPSTSSKTSTGWRLWDVQKDDVNDPTSLVATLKSLGQKRSEEVKSKTIASTSHGGLLDHSKQTTTTQSDTEIRKRKLMKIAPKLPFDIDLYHWEDKDLKAPSVEIVETDGHKFWTPSQDRAGEVIDDPNGIASLRTRVIEFSGEFEPVKWSCRAPLPSGSLCPRKDRVKCPLHGKIIARDDIGNPTKLEDIQALNKEKEMMERDKPPEWQDPQFLKEIEAATGMDLTIRPPKKGKKKKKTFTEMYPGLTDVDRKRNTPRSRLERKIFNKASVKRVAETLDELSAKRFNDKFGDQWNYSMGNE